MKSYTILITDGENRSSLAATRSLGRAGCRVVVVGNSKRNLSSCSKYCAACYRIPSPVTGGNDFVEAINDLVTHEKIQVVYPMSEPTAMLLAESKEQLQTGTVLACPSIDKIRLVFSKFEIFKLAQKHNIQIPETLFVRNKDELMQNVDKLPEFPVVVKPSMSRIPGANGFIFTAVRYASNMDELLAVYQTDEALNYPSMIQEKIIGPGTGLFTLFDGNRHLALFSHKRLREKPPSGGVSVVSESIALDSEMVAASQKLLQAVHWNGVAMVEFKRDVRDGQAKLMEINGRFWGTLQLAISSGIDFPLLLLQYLLGELISPQHIDYRYGLKMKWILGTLDHLFIRLKNTDELNVPPNFPSKWQAVMDFLRVYEPKATYDVFQREDIEPFICEVKRYVQDLFFKSR